jgi:hypothetical protein
MKSRPFPTTFLDAFLDHDPQPRRSPGAYSRYRPRPRNLFNRIPIPDVALARNASCGGISRRTTCPATSGWIGIKCNRYRGRFEQRQRIRRRAACLKSGTRRCSDQALREISIRQPESSSKIDLVFLMTNRSLLSFLISFLLAREQRLLAASALR